MTEHDATEPAKDSTEKKTGKPPAQYQNSILDIVEILWSQTDEFHGIRPRAIAHELQYGPSERTVYNQCRWLLDEGNNIEFLTRHFGEVNVKAAAAEGCTDATPGLYMEPMFSVAEARLLADSLMLSRISSDEFNDLIAKLTLLIGRPNSEQIMNMPARISGYEHYNPEFLYVIDHLNDAIVRNKVVEFHYCSYGPDGRLTPRLNDDGEPRNYKLEPYSLVYKNGIYYLLGHFYGNPVPDTATQEENRTNIYCFMADRITDITIDEDTDIQVPASTWDMNGLPMKTSAGISDAGQFDPIQFAHSRPNMTMGTLEHIVLNVRSDMISNLYEWFDQAKVSESDIPDYYRVEVNAPELATLWWVLQFAEWDNVRVVEPISLRERLAQVGRKLYEHYSERGEDALNY